MKLITRDTDYAVRALCYIANHKGKVVAVRLLVKELRIPRPFLRKILQVLNKKGILKSSKGQRGGFVLAKPANEIFLIELLKIFQGPLELSACLFKKKICPDRNICALRQKISNIEKYVISELKVINIESLL